MSPLFPAQTSGTRRAAVAKPGENRFAYATAQQFNVNACKVTNQDSAGGCSIFESIVPFQFGPPLHLHHREDEWFYVLSGDFVFEVGGEQFRLPVGGSVLAPRGVSHCWANTSKTEGKLIIM